MWSFNVTPIQRLLGTLALLTFLASCTVEPLNATSSSRLTSDGTSASVQEVMKSHVSTRTLTDPSGWGTLTLR